LLHSELAMTTSVKKLCLVLFSATVLAISGLAHAEKDFDRESAAKTIAESESFTGCHAIPGARDVCDWTNCAPKVRNCATVRGIPSMKASASKSGSPFWTRSMRIGRAASVSPQNSRYTVFPIPGMHHRRVVDSALLAGRC
jgi:hypothetical protein